MGYYYSDPQLGHTATLSYDNVNRLIGATATGTANYSGTYSYDDQFGNMKCTINSGPVVCPTVTYNAANNRLTAIGSATPHYDAAGNMLNDGTGSLSHSYTWDAEGRMTSANWNGTTATYSYNALGQRVQRSGTGIGPYDLYEYYDAFGNLALEGDNTTSNEDLFPKVGGRLYGEYLYYTTFLHANALGSTGVTTAQDGTFIGDEIYDPWGQRWGTWNNLLGERFAGMQRVDKESGRSRTPNRMFASQYGRWLSPDPDNGGAESGDPQTWNAYAYIGNNPTSRTDPEGTNYTLCGVNGEDCQDLTDPQYDAWRRQNPDVHASPSGDLTVTKKNGDSVKIGTESYYNEHALDSLLLAGRMAAPMTDARTYALWTGGSAVGGGVLYLGGAFGGGLTTLTISAATAGPLVTDPDLQRIVNWMFQVTDKLPGGTAGAVRYELMTGDTVGGASHLQKAADIITRLNNLLRSGKLSFNDQVTARALIQQLQNALSTRSGR